MKPTLCKGQLETWKDDRGFGFIKPDDGSKEVFLHISALNRAGRRPKIGDTIFYKLTTEANGKVRASNASIQGVALLPSLPTKQRVKKGGLVERVIGIGVMAGMALFTMQFSRSPSPSPTTSMEFSGSPSPSPTTSMEFSGSSSPSPTTSVEFSGSSSPSPTTSMEFSGSSSLSPTTSMEFSDSISPSPITSLVEPGCTIKGNISINTGNKLYHLPGMEDYESTVINPAKGERWFCTESEAIAKGWRKAPIRK